MSSMFVILEAKLNSKYFFLVFSQKSDIIQKHNFIPLLRIKVGMVTNKVVLIINVLKNGRLINYTVRSLFD